MIVRACVEKSAVPLINIVLNSSDCAALESNKPVSPRQWRLSLTAGPLRQDSRPRAQLLSLEKAEGGEPQYRASRIPSRPFFNSNWRRLLGADGPVARSNHPL